MSTLHISDPTLENRKRRRVETWLSSLLEYDNQESSCDWDRDRDRDRGHDDDVDDNLKPSKRTLFLDSNSDGSNHLNTPETPSLTNFVEAGAKSDAISYQPEPPHTPAEAQISSRQNRDEGCMAMEVDENELTRAQPNPRLPNPPAPSPPPRTHPSKKQGLLRTPSPRKPGLERSVLLELQKPLQVLSLLDKIGDALAQLPADVAPLYKKIMMISDEEPIIPYEVWEEVTEIAPVRKCYFRDPDPAEGAREQALDVLKSLNVIRDKASQALTHMRHEAAWNIHVYSPLLEMVFEWRVPDEASGDIAAPRARVEPVMSAAIAGNSIPMRISGDTVMPACSVAIGSEWLGSDSSQGSPTPSKWSMSQLRSHSAKVDYVVALDVPAGTPIEKKIKWTILHAGLHLHVNQTSYEPLRYSPIAISFKMKTGPGDPFVQLGIWAAAWHKRMYDLRDRLVRAGPKPRLVSIPLVQVRGHHWSLFFACDEGSSVAVYGPFGLGSTNSIPSLYMLLRSLEAMRDWVEETFYASMKEWFQVADDE